jgi:hypothetical protein
VYGSFIEDVTRFQSEVFFSLSPYYDHNDIYSIPIFHSTGPLVSVRCDADFLSVI